MRAASPQAVSYWPPASVTWFLSKTGIVLPAQNGGFPMSKKRNRAAFLYVLPCLVVLGLFVYYPLVMNVTYSFQSFTLSAVTKQFVGAG